MVSDNIPTSNPQQGDHKNLTEQAALSKGMGGTDISGEDSALPQSGRADENLESNREEAPQSSAGHNLGSLDETQQQAPKPKADSPATAGIANRDEDAADPNLAQEETSKSFDRDQEELELGLDDGDLDNDVS